SMANMESEQPQKNDVNDPVVKSVYPVEKQ
ncbi:hypothetical protein Tco_1441364, partial [Tanacetum coccineum]